MDFIETLLVDHGTIAVFVLMLLSSACIPVPSELVLLYGGYLASEDKVGFWAIVIWAMIGTVVGSIIAWAIGAYGGREFVLRHQRKLHLSESKLELAERWFDRYGAWAVVVARVLPIVRAFISLPAGIMRMPIAPFTIYTTLGSLPWVLGLAGLGLALGPHWEDAQQYFHYLDVLLIAGVIGGLGYWLYRRRSRAGAPPAT